VITHCLPCNICEPWACSLGGANAYRTHMAHTVERAAMVPYLLDWAGVLYI
jgi:hypothetical protein